MLSNSVMTWCLRAFLTAILGAAGATKIADISGAQSGLSEFGVPRAIANALAVVLPVTEMVIAAALMVPQIAFWGSLAALGLFVVFTGWVAAAATRGPVLHCPCFGQTQAGPMGVSMLWRNTVLTMVASFLVWSTVPGRNPFTGWNRIVDRSHVVAVVSGVLLAFAAAPIVLRVLRPPGNLGPNLHSSNYQLLDRLYAITPGTSVSGLSIGYNAPPFQLKNLEGELLTLESLRAYGIPLVLAFASPRCGSCDALVPELARFQELFNEALRIIVIASGDLKENGWTKHSGGLTLLVQNDWEVGRAYNVTRTPSALVVRPDGKIGSRLAQGSEQVVSLIRDSVAGD